MDSGPRVTWRCCTASAANTNTVPVLPATAVTASAGTSTGGALALAARRAPPGPGPAGSRKDTRTPMSGTMRRSRDLMAMRTFTVALLRSAVGMMAMTSPGILHSG